MSIATLSKGYLKPSNPTTGDLWFPALETDIQLMNDHIHDGQTGAVTPSTTGTILAANWGTVSADGDYHQTITMPAGRSYDTTQISFRYSTGQVVYPAVVRVSNTQYNVYTNDNTLSFVALYG